MRVFILDEITVKPGLAAQYRELYREQYMPGAKRRGMQLEGAWQNPPGMDFPERPTTLYYLWSVEDTRAWWAMRLSRTPEGRDERFDKHAFWQRSDSLTAGRSRKFLSALDDLPGAG